MKTQILLVFFAACIAALMPTGGANAKARGMQCRSAVESARLLVLAPDRWTKMLVRRQDHDLEITVAVACEGVGASESRSKASAGNRCPGNRRPGATENRSDPLDAQARMLDYANSFEARWRARAITD